METSSGDLSQSTSAQAAADLRLLERAKSAVQFDEVLDLGPRWYAPMLATMVGGLSLFGQGFSSSFWNAIVGISAVAAGGVMSVHDYRRRTVRSRPSIRGAVAVAVIVLICWAVVAAWGTAISSIGFERFVPTFAIVGWVLTTVFFLAVRAGLNAVRARRAPLR